MSALNANQVRRVIATFTHVDALLRDIERLARADLSPLAKERADVAPDEAALLQSFVALARGRLLAALDRLGIPRPRPTTSARWAVETTLTFAEIALSELGPSDLAGYGTVDLDAAGELEALVADLSGILTRARRLLHEQETGGLSQRLAAIPGPAGEIVRRIDAVSREHALAEVRPLLAAAVERATSTTFDVGVFGRVSAGKSSLINALVGASVLPVGATPITAVPIRLTRGPEHVELDLQSGEVRTIATGELAAYATEDGNPGNRAGVRSIELRMPSVPHGLRMLDTPGVGSISASGPALAFAWLPRCDLGLVLVAAGTPVGRDDLALVTGLRQAGIRCVVLLSKADLLSSAERDRAIEYVRREVAESAGDPQGGRDMTIEVLPVSSAIGHDADLDAFRASVLAPLAQAHEHAARHALAARLEQLVRSTAAALARRVAPRDTSHGQAGPSDATIRLEQALATARTRIRAATDALDAAAPTILEAAAAATIAAWERGEDARAAVRAAVIGASGEVLGDLRRLLDDVRAVASPATGITASERRRLPPLFDPEFLDALPALAPPRLGRRIVGHSIATHRLEPIEAPLVESLHRYAMALYAWGNGALDELSAEAWEFPGADGPAEDHRLPAELAALEPALAALAHGDSDGSTPTVSPADPRGTD